MTSNQTPTALRHNAQPASRHNGRFVFGTRRLLSEDQGGECNHGVHPNVRSWVTVARRWDSSVHAGCALSSTPVARGASLRRAVNSRGTTIPQRECQCRQNSSPKKNRLLATPGRNRLLALGYTNSTTCTPGRQQPHRTVVLPCPQSTPPKKALSAPACPGRENEGRWRRRHWRALEVAEGLTGVRGPTAPPCQRALAAVLLPAAGHGHAAG